jgi:hypothetical protein
MPRARETPEGLSLPGGESPGALMSGHRNLDAGVLREQGLPPRVVELVVVKSHKTSVRSSP